MSKILGIDASNLRQGGGVTYIVELLSNIDPNSYGFKEVCVWSCADTLNRIEKRDEIKKFHNPILEKPLWQRQLWQRFDLIKQVNNANCDILFVPGGSDGTGFRPMVTMSHNMLPFEWKELFRYGFSLMTLKLLLLRLVQKSSFKRSDGMIFLTGYAKTKILKSMNVNNIPKYKTIPHGIDRRFFNEPNNSLPIEKYSSTNPFKILYVSIIDVYKHQINVVKAFKILISKGYPIELKLVGPSYKPSLKKLFKELKNDSSAINYLGSVDHSLLHEIYQSSHLNVFASSCENMPNILLEAMASGLPIACSNLGPMPEILGDAGLYFHPEKPDEIAQAIEKLILDPELRTKLAQVSYEKAKQYSWKRTAHETFSFLRSVYENYNLS